MKTVIEMAREVGYPLVEYEGTPYIPPLLEVLLKAVRADEREQCAKEAESWDCHLAAAEIRARSNT